MSPDTTHFGRRGRIERQRHLPLSRAIELSLKSIKVRFWRSMLTVASIILAIAFLMSQLTSAEISRRLEEVAKERVEVGGKMEWRVDVDARRLLGEAEKRKAEAEELAQRLKPVFEEYERALARLQAAKALADVEVERKRFQEAKRHLELAEKAFKDPQIQRIGADYQADERERRRLKSWLETVGSSHPQYNRICEQLEEVQRRLRRRRSAYKEFLKRRSEYLAALARFDDARDRLGRAETAAAEARRRFPDLKPAPEGSEAYDELYRRFREARRAKDRAERRIQAAKRRADRAAKRFENASHKALEQLLVKHGQRSVEGEESQVGEVHLPLGLRLTSTRLWIIALALLVCLVGITNAMLMSVTERYREIGTMKCLGALDSFIVKIFLLESSFMGVIGVFIGVVLGFLLGFLVQWRNYGGFVLRYFPAMGVLKWAAVAVLIGAVLAVLGGILPARRAAKMTPVDAMRIEE